MAMAIALALWPRPSWRGIRRLLLALSGLGGTVFAVLLCLEIFPYTPAAAIVVGALGVGITMLIWQQSGRRMPMPLAYTGRQRALPKPSAIHVPASVPAGSAATVGLSDAVQLAGATLYYLHRAASQTGGRPLKRETPLVSLFSGIATFLLTAYRGRCASAEHSIAVAESVISRYWAMRRTEKGGSVALVGAALRPEHPGLPIGGFILAHLCGDGGALERLVDMAIPGLGLPEKNALARVAAELVADLTDHLGTPPAPAPDFPKSRPTATPWRYQ